MEKPMQKWSELRPATKVGIGGLLALHLSLVAAAHTDLTRRPAERIHGPKWVWRLLTVANSSFSVAYFVWGRHKPVA